MKWVEISAEWVAGRKRWEMKRQCLVFNSMDTVGVVEVKKKRSSRTKRKQESAKCSCSGTINNSPENAIRQRTILFPNQFAELKWPTEHHQQLHRDNFFFFWITMSKEVQNTFILYNTVV